MIEFVSAAKYESLSIMHFSISGSRHRNKINQFKLRVTETYFFVVDRKGRDRNRRVLRTEPRGTPLVLPSY